MHIHIFCFAQRIPFKNIYMYEQTKFVVQNECAWICIARNYRVSALTTNIRVRDTKFIRTEMYEHKIIWESFRWQSRAIGTCFKHSTVHGKLLSPSRWKVIQNVGFGGFLYKFKHWGLWSRIIFCIMRTHCFKKYCVLIIRTKPQHTFKYCMHARAGFTACTSLSIADIEGCLHEPGYPRFKEVWDDFEVSKLVFLKPNEHMLLLGWLHHCPDHVIYSFQYLKVISRFVLG